MNVMVHGRIHYTKWADATGVDRFGCEIIAEKVDFLSLPRTKPPRWSTVMAKSRSEKNGVSPRPGGDTRRVWLCSAKMRQSLSGHSQQNS